MKNSNLLNRLLSYSHEKQKPQRFARYAAMLIMLLTLGVGQMWADGQYNMYWKGKVYFRAPNSWDLSTYKYTRLGVARTTDTNTNTYQDFFGQMTQISNTRLFYLNVSADHSGWKQNEYIFFVSNEYSSYGSGTFKVNNSHYYTVPKDYGCNNSSNYYLFNPSSDTDGPAVDASWDDTRNDLFKLSNTIAVKVKKAGSGSYTTPSSTTEMPATTVGVTAYYLNGDASSTSNTVSCSGSTYSASFYGCPGGKITLSQTAKDGYTFDGFYVSSSSVTSPYYPTSGSAITIEARYTEDSYSLTFSHDGNGSIAVAGSTIASGSTAVVGYHNTKTLVATPNTGYQFTGWTLTGTNTSAVTIADLTSTGASTTIKATNTGATVTAGFEKKTYSITLDKGDGDTDGSATIQRGDGALTISDHASRDEWNLVGYWTSGGDQLTDDEGNLIASVSGYTDSYGKWIYDDDATLTAHWSQTFSLTVNAGSNISSVTGSNADVTLGSKYAISATPNTGYSFSGWTASPAANGTFDDASSASTNVTVKNGNVIVTGAATENMTTVTVNVSPAGAGTLTLDASAFTPGNTTTAGVATSHTVVASANSGYTFLGWYKSGNTAGTSSTNTYTLKGNGSAGTGTLTAIFAANASSNWYLIGQPFGNSWATNNHSYPLNLKYRGMSNVYMRVVAFGGGSNSYFKPMKNNSPYGQSSGSDVSVVTGTQYTISATSAENTAFKTNGQGTVWCIVDETNNKFWVQTPVDYFPVTFSNGSSGNVLDGTQGTISLKTKNYGELATIYYALNESIKVAVTAKSGYWIDDISLNGSSVATDVNASSWDGWVTMPATTATLTVTYNRIYSLSYNANGGSGAAPATTYYISGTNATAAAASTFTARAYYTFGGWNTAQYITGTNYAAGASVPMTANTTLYAKWTRSVTLNQEDATTTGSTSVTGTYNCATLPAITNPEKTGYEFGGWYTEVAGGGNIIINTSGALQADKYHWTDASGRFDRTTEKAAADLYAKWTQTVTLNANTSYHGSGDNTTATIVYKATAKTSITHCTPATGYHLVGYYSAADGGTKILEANGDFADDDITVSEDDYIVGGAWVHAGNTTLYAHYEPIKYTVTLNPGTGGSGSGTMEIYYDDDEYDTWSHDITQTGYHIEGWYDNGEKLKVLNDDGTFADDDVENYITDGKWTKAANCTLQAWWDPNGYTVTLDKQTEAEGYSASGTVGNQDVAYNTALPSMAGSTAPTAANGYAFMGFYTEEGGEGLKVINANLTWVASVAGYTNGSSQWIHDGNVTLYAYYKKAEITALVASPGVIAPDETITITPTISPTPTGTTKVCYELQYSNGTPLPSQPTFNDEGGNAVSFIVPHASATYKIEAKLYTGSTCGSGTLLSTLSTTFQVAGDHTVTVRYQDSEGRTLAASIEVTGKPLEWSDPITAPTITGYTFHHWLAGDGVTLSEDGTNAKTGVRADSSVVSPVYIKANYDGTLTAVYNKKNMIFFNNTLGWEDVWVYFYTSNKYWADDWGTGAWRGQYFNGDRPYYDMHRGHMTQIEGTNIWYFDYTAKGWDGWENVAFTNMGDQTGQGASADAQALDNDHAYFSNTTDNPIQVVRRGDHKTTLPMFVPLTGQTGTLLNNNKANYVNHGYWMNYPENTGYTLKIYSGTTYGTSDQLQSIPFEFTGDMTLPMSVNVELNAKTTYGFEIHRADGTKLGENSYTLKSGDSGDDGETVRTLGSGERSKITTAVAGDYTFKLNYGKVSSEYHYLIGVHYPVATGDYRVLYTDDATWSKGAHSADYAWWHESRTIHKEDGAEDIVSFYVKKDKDTEMKFQYASSINASSGAVTWTDVTSGNISLSGITVDGVYNFYLTQADGGISVSKIEPYTGKYYIRTDCAGNTKWENFRTLDHQMTYSDYAETKSGYSHYYAHWVTSGTNVKFCIANDYSQCITDTLSEDYETVIANITAEGNDGAGTLNSASASIRFMWNQATNKISRAYISGSSIISDRFLVLEGDAKMFDENGNALSISGLNANEINLVDDQNFVYEREIQVQTTARAKLTAKYNENVQYFKGSEGDFAEETTIELLGGTVSATKHTMRIVYDFKTNRLVTAYVPSGTIESNMAINADLMIVREHQEAGQQLLFNGGSLSSVHTVYGVMRFNRWTLNNKNTTVPHGIVADPKSAYERGLYWISFPFDVNLSDVFGFGTYGTDWILMEYNGAKRATEGYWADSKGFWEYVMPSQRATFELKAGTGYVLALDLDRMKDNNTDFWTNSIEQVELFFPSAANVNNISATNVETTVPEHECTIDRRTDKNTPDINKDRTVVDSHWNLIGVPSYANYGKALTSDGSTTVTWHNPSTEDLPYLYEWNMTDNSYTPQTGSTYPFKSMHGYMVQYHGDLYWSLASATPATPAPRRYEGALKDVEYRLELQQNEKKIDQTFVKMSNEENASAGFSFDEDLCKEYNANKANIYTFIEGYIPAAGNTLPMSEQTTVVPVGVKIATNGEYTFAMPDGTDGIGITLIDNETGIRTSLSALDYTVNLTAGTYNERFVLEISPIHHMPTGIEEVTGDGLQVTGARKLMIDGLLYIVKDGKMFDARGARVQ